MYCNCSNGVQTLLQTIIFLTRLYLLLYVVPPMTSWRLLLLLALASSQQHPIDSFVVYLFEVSSVINEGTLCQNMMFDHPFARGSTDGRKILHVASSEVAKYGLQRAVI